MYISPPFDVLILCELIEFVLDKPRVPVSDGDFNMVMDLYLDRFPQEHKRAT